MKTYSPGSEELERCVQKMRTRYHPELEGVTIGLLFVFDPEDSAKQVLQHGGYAAAAMIRKTPLRERALGTADAVMIVDRAFWMSIKGQQCEALVDHELYHLKRCIDPETKQKLVDALGRPKLEMRKHDRQFGWFDEIAKRHGEFSMEVRQAKSLMAETSQLYFDFKTTQVAA